MKKKIILIICLVLSLFGCSNKLKTDSLTIELEPKFGGVYVHKTIEEFTNMGFEYGDSVDVKFSNGFELIDIPFYDGYYTKQGLPLVVAYPGYPYIDVCNNNGQVIYEEGNIDETMTVTIELNTKGKYLTVQEALKTVYTNSREDYESDEIFSNFRTLSGGNLKENLIYRSASPCDNQYNRATYVSGLCEANGIKTIIDLADNEDEARSYYDDANLDCSYWKLLYENGSVYPLDFSSNYRSDSYIAKVKEVMNIIINNDGPYLLHCTEGKDRTGFICGLLETLASANKDELEADYMKTYENYYDITKNNNSDKYEAIIDVKFSDIVSCIAEDKEVNDENLFNGAISYLLKTGMDKNDIDLLIEKISK